jgi:hypothetical protein
MARQIPCFAWLLVLSLGPTAFGQTIRLRVVNSQNGKPLANQQVSLSLLYQEGEPAPAKHVAALTGKTDTNGEARFDLPQPPPGHIAAEVPQVENHWHCACMLLLATQDVIEKGILELQPGDKSRTSGLAARPGIILLAARPLTFIERLLYPLEKE